MKSISDRLTELRKLNGIDLQSPGEPLRLRITVGDPALSSEIDFVTRRGHVPDEVVDMWRVSRETRLFEDVDYGQWGLVLLSPKAALERTAWERKIRPDELLMNDFVIGEFLEILSF